MVRPPRRLGDCWTLQDRRIFDDQHAGRTIPCIVIVLAARHGLVAHRDPLRNSPMIDFAAARRMMVDGQVRTSDVTDLRLIAAMLEVPRERFVPEAKADLAYLDLDLPAMEGKAGAPVRRLLKPMVL